MTNMRVPVLLGAAILAVVGGLLSVRVVLPGSGKIRYSSSAGGDYLAHVSYSQLRQAVIDTYHASDPETTDLEEEFDDALLAMELIESDGLPIPIGGNDGLYVGGIGAAYNLQGLTREGITHILSLERAAPCKFPGFKCMHIDTIWDDESDKNRISPYFPKTLPFIHQALSNGGRILVHCWGGKSRSVSIIMGYLVKYKGMRPDHALRLIRETRPIARPNNGYLHELVDFYDKLLEEKANNGLNSLNDKDDKLAEEVQELIEEAGNELPGDGLGETADDRKKNNGRDSFNDEEETALNEQEEKVVESVIKRGGKPGEKEGDESTKDDGQD